MNVKVAIVVLLILGLLIAYKRDKLAGLTTKIAGKPGAPKGVSSTKAKNFRQGSLLSVANASPGSGVGAVQPSLLTTYAVGSSPAGPGLVGTTYVVGSADLSDE